MKLFWIQRQQRLAKRRLRILAEEETLLSRAERAGDATAAESAAAEKAANAARVDAERLRGEMDAERLALDRAVGFPPTAAFQLQASAGFLPRAGCSVGRPSGGLEERRLDLVALRIGYSSQEARLRAAVREQFPRLSLGPTGGRDNDGVWTAGFGIRIGLPLFDRNQAKIAAATATRKELFDEYAFRLFTARQDVADYRSGWDSVQRRARALAQALPSLRRKAAACQTAMTRGDLTRKTCLPLTEAALAVEAELLQQRRLQDELAIALDLATGTWHQPDRERRKP